MVMSPIGLLLSRKAQLGNLMNCRKLRQFRCRPVVPYVSLFMTADMTKKFCTLTGLNAGWPVCKRCLSLERRQRNTVYLYILDKKYERKITQSIYRRVGHFLQLPTYRLQ